MFTFEAGISGLCEYSLGARTCWLSNTTEQSLQCLVLLAPQWPVSTSILKGNYRLQSVIQSARVDEWPVRKSFTWKKKKNLSFQLELQNEFVCYTGWSKMYLRLNSTSSTTSDEIWRNFVGTLKYYVICLSLVFVRFCTVPISGYSSSKGPFEHLKNASVKVRCQSLTGQAYNFKFRQFWTITLTAAGLQLRGLRPIFKQFEGKYTENIETENGSRCWL